MERKVAEQNQEDFQRWPSKRKAAVVLRILKGETSIQEAARKNGNTIAKWEDWKERFVLAAENALCKEQIKKLQQKIDSLEMDTKILREVAERHPQRPGRSEQQSKRSPATQSGGFVGCWK